MAGDAVLIGRDLHDADSMRATDAAAIAAGVPGTRLMAAAGEAVAHVVRVRFAAARRVVCVCGGGANGGDGLVAARRLRALGVDASCLVVASRPYEGDALDACEAAVAAGVPVSRVGAVGDGLRGADVVVDALLGTGRTGEPRGAVAEAIRAIGDAGVPVVAVDVPSGVDASTGEVAAVAVSADVTVTFHAPKLGHVVLPGLAHAGRLVVVPIGIPAVTGVPAPAVLVGPATVASLAGRPSFGSKYDAGNVLAIGGSRGMTGAIVLCAPGGSARRRRPRGDGGAGVGAAGRRGPGAGADDAGVRRRRRRPAPWPRPTCCWSAPGAARRRRSGRAAVATAGTAALVRHIVPLVAAPVVLDADGLHAIGTDLELLAARTAPTVITPHAGEAARLLGTTTERGRRAPPRDRPHAGRANRRRLRAEGRRHDHRGARRVARGARRRRPAPRHRRDRRRPLRHDRRRAGRRRVAVRGSGSGRRGAPGRGAVGAGRAGSWWPRTWSIACTLARPRDTTGGRTVGLSWTRRARTLA